MATEDKVFTGNIPAIYEKFMVPMLFEPYAHDIAERLAKFQPKTILELAAGTGAVTRAVAQRLASDARMTVTDLNQPMLDEARARLGDDGRITWQQADALALPFADQSFDAAICQFGAMFFPDKIKGYSEAKRVLKPGGHLIFNVWDRLANNEFVVVVQDVLNALFPADQTRFMERTPHGYHDTQAITEQLKSAGFSNVSAEAVELKSRAESALAAATGYCQGNPLRNEIEARMPGGLATVTQKVADALEKRFGTGPIEGKISAFVITAY
jgi:ubiquinone/menaquinone biosynthesis C-methylase UbiE